MVAKDEETATKDEAIYCLFIHSRNLVLLEHSGMVQCSFD